MHQVGFSLNESRPSLWIILRFKSGREKKNSRKKNTTL